MKKNNPVNRTIAELKLEGISVPSELRQDMVLRNKGKISDKEFLTRAIKRATNHKHS